MGRDIGLHMALAQRFYFRQGLLAHAMGFREIPRDEYLRCLIQAERQAEKPGRWRIETDLKTVADWQPA